MIKDWKRITEENGFDYSKGFYIWKKNKTYIYITWFGSQGNVGYDVRKTSSLDTGGTRLKHKFKSQAKAIKYAKSWMAKH